MRRTRFIRSALPSLFVLVPLMAGAQGTLDDYRRAATVSQRLAGLTVNVAQVPTWIGSDRFWYRKSVKGGNEFVMVARRA